MRLSETFHVDRDIPRKQYQTLFKPRKWSISENYSSNAGLGYVEFSFRERMHSDMVEMKVKSKETRDRNAITFLPSCSVETPTLGDDCLKFGSSVLRIRTLS